MKRLGTFADEDIIEAIKEAASKPQPYLVAHGIAPSGPDRAVTLTHDAALAAGLPEIRGYYGIDLKTGEFLGVDHGSV